uniref:Zinc fingers and homeoboxes 2a n=1 Tax=Electrophorus electricus TaxID=8005 RepID=A0A4W4FLR5_ELEEL
MSSRRKSFTPCMVCVMSLREGGAEGVEERHWEGTGGKIEDKQQGRDYHCKYCSFSTPHLNGFKEHVYAAHPNVILNPLYLCAVCNFSTKKFDSLTEHNETQHQGESNFKFKRIKLDNQTILEQTIENEDSSNYPDIEHMQDDDDGFDFLPSYPNFPNIGKPLVDNTEAFINGNEVESHLDLMLKDQITAVNVNGTLIIPEPMVLQGLSHVMPLLQRPPNLNSVPTIAVPLNTSKYNPLLDSNTTLITSFNRFPYPTHAELSWLTAASKHPEEQIKVWFTTQRLKQGITWSPEEVEEARKKMFNGCMPPSHHTFTILPTPVREPVTTSTSVAPAASCQVIGSLVSPKTRNQIPASSVISKDKLSSLPTDVNLPLVPPLVTSQAKRPTIIQTARAKPVAPPLIPTFSLECKPLEPSVEQKPTGSESRPSESQNSNGVPCGDGKNWFTDQSAPAHNGSRHLNSEFAPKERPKMVPTQFPLLERVKGKTAEQLKVLEESFQRNSFPSHNEVDHIAITTRLSREEIDSWFLERRALRDNLEKALLNSMGSKRTETHALLNGVHKQGGLPMSPLPPIIAPTSSSVPLDRKSLNLLKDVFVQTRWPSPEEYSRLEAQTGLARANIVRWFKDSRLSLRSGAGEKKAFLHNLSSGEHNGRLIIDQPCSLARSGQERKMPGGECAKLSSQEIKDWFNSPLGHRRPDVGRNGGQNGGGGQDCGGWGEEAVGVRMASQELVSDTD